MFSSLRKIAAGGILAAGLAFAASAQAQTPMTFQLNWVAGGANAGFASAVGENYYKDAGLNVTLVQGNGSGNTVQLVASGRALIGYADAVAIMQLVAKGAPLKVISTVYQSNPNEVSALKKTGIKSIKDLAGKKVGVPSGSSQTTMLPLFLKANNLKESDMTLMNMPPTAMVPALLQGQVDAILGSMDAYQIQLEAQGAELDNFRFADYGVPTVSTSIFANETYLKDNAEIVKKFVAASLKGWDFAIKNPEKAVKNLKAVFPEMNEKLAAAELAAIGPLFCSGGAKFLGKAEDAHWTRSQELLSEVGLLPAGQDPKGYYSNAFLPAEAQMTRLQALDAKGEGRPDEHDTATWLALCRPYVGLEFRSPGRTITDADLVGFAGLTGDFSELHTSDVYAKNSQFGRRVAHGLLGLTYAHGLMWARTGELRETAIAFLGINDWKFAGPIFVGDTIFVNYRLAELRDSKSRPTQAIAVFDVAVVNQDEQVVQSGKKALLVSKVPLTAVAASGKRGQERT